jgi:thiamine transport system permease protein
VIPALAVAVVGVAVVVPLVAVLLRAVRVDGGWSTEALGRMLGSARTWRLVVVTFAQAASSTLLTLAVGLPVAWVLARIRFPGAAALRTVAMVPFVLPSVVVGAAFASLLGPRGLVDLRGTWWAVLAAHMCFNLAVAIRVVEPAVRAVPASLVEAARSSGATRSGAARRVVWPLVGPSVRTAATIVFLFCLTSFGVVVVLGGGPVTTLEVELWMRATRQFDLSGAAVLAGLQAVMVLCVLLVSTPGNIALAGRSGGGRPRRRCGNRWDRLAVGGAVVLVVLLAVVPIAALFERSLAVPGGHGLAHWRNLGSAAAGTGLAVDPLSTVWASLRAAGMACALAVVLGLPAAAAVARRPHGIASRTLLLPLAVSATSVGLGLLLVAGRPPVDLRRSAALIVIAQTMVALPLLVRTVAPALAGVPPSVRDAARLSGAGPWRRWWRVELPMVRPAVVAGVGLAFVAAMGEFGATVFVARTAAPTMPVAIERLLSRPGAAGLGQAMALSCLLVGVCGAVLWAIDRPAPRAAGSEAASRPPPLPEGDRGRDMVHVRRSRGKVDTLTDRRDTSGRCWGPRRRHRCRPAVR